MVSKTVAAFLLCLSCWEAFACFPKNPMTSFVTPDRYAYLPSELIDLLRKSYLRHTKDNRFLDNAFWGANPEDDCSWPDSLWSALDKLGPKGIYTIVSIYEKTNEAYVSSSMVAIKNVWFGTSYGITFEGMDATTQGLENFIKGRATFCKDTDVISHMEHNGQTCWRQIPRDSRGQGLHFCFGAGKPLDVHIDFHQVAMGKVPFSELCIYDPALVIKHNMDLKGKAPKTIFDVLEDEAKELQRLLQESNISKKCQGIDKYLYQTNLEKMIGRLSPHQLLKLATLGQLAHSTGNDLLKSIEKEKTTLFSFTYCSCL